MQLLDTNIYIKNDLITNRLLLTELCGGSRLIIVTESAIAKHYLSDLLLQLNGFEYSVLEIPGGEKNKNWQTVELIIQHLIAHNHDRNSLLISFAGGVLGDLCGFSASIYMRGINWLQIPTTLLAQVDASIGGKTGFNFAGAKNLLGSFHQPKAILINPNFIQTLSEREFLSGLAEVVKYGMSLDANFFTWLEDNVAAIKARDPDILQTMIMRCCTLKHSIVKQDEKELGLRMKLNFGHTFAHALESATNFDRYLHGEAVALGMLLATHLAVKLGLVDLDLLVRLRGLLTNLGLQIRYDTSICSVKMLFDYIKMDKKRRGDELCLIMPCCLGQVRSQQYTDMNYLEGLVDGYTNS